MAHALGSQDQESDCSAIHKVIALLDIDSFECQIYKRLYPDFQFWGKAWIVADQTGRIVSATHEARQLGISRDIRLREAQRLAKQHKLDLQVFRKPNDREKPDAKEVRYASWEILDCLKDYVNNYSFGVTLEYSSSDEFYLDLTTEVNLRMQEDNDFLQLIESRTFLEGRDQTFNGGALRDKISCDYLCPQEDSLKHEKMLVCGGLIMQEVNNFLFSQTKLIASVGIGSNKLLAKLGVSLHKPSGITILLQDALPRLGNDIKIEKIPGLGSTFGSYVKEIFSISTMNELTNIEFEQLEEVFEEDKATEIFIKCRGISDEPVKEKLMNEEVSSGKTFFGQITSNETLYYHMYQLIEELLERLEEELERHSRQPSVIRFTVSYSPKERGQEDQKLSCAHTVEYDPAKSCTAYCENAMHLVFGVKKIEIEKVQVSRLEVRARGFTNFTPQG